MKMFTERLGQFATVALTPCCARRGVFLGTVRATTLLLAPKKTKTCLHCSRKKKLIVINFADPVLGGNETFPPLRTTIEARGRAIQYTHAGAARNENQENA
jgi:hypothetical protein